MDVRLGAIPVPTEDGGEALVPAVELILSERNLRSLLLSLNDDENAITRFTESGFLLILRGETNDVHYADRPAGMMDEKLENELLREELGADETLFIPPNFGKLND